MNNEYKMVPRELLERIEYLMRLCDMDPPCVRELRELLAAAVPPQGDAQPVFYAQTNKVINPEGWRGVIKAVPDTANGYVFPLYTRPDAGENDKLREWAKEASAEIDRLQGIEAERDTLRAQLAERDALLSEIADHCNGCVMPTEQLLRDWGSSIDAALSASAEPGVKP